MATESLGNSSVFKFLPLLVEWNTSLDMMACCTCYHTTIFILCWFLFEQDEQRLGLETCIPNLEQINEYAVSYISTFYSKFRTMHSRSNKRTTNAVYAVITHDLFV